MNRLRKFNLDLYQICVMTPFPKTKLWGYISKEYGIFDYNWQNYDAKHLVWNHPNIKPEEMNSLLRWSFRRIYSGKTFVKSTFKFRRKYSDLFGFSGGLKYMTSSILNANLFDYIGIMNQGLNGIK